MSKPTATVGTAEMQPSRPAPSSSAGLHAGESSTLLDPEKQSTAGKTARKTSKLYMLKLSHHTLTSLVSIAIAALQLIIYLSYQHGKNIPGAWPNKPYLIPTLLLLGVAVAALGFDICAIVAYCLPSSRSSKNLDRTAKGFGMLITGLKGLGFAVAASSGKTAFDGGTNSAKNNDLWGWSCSDQAAQMQSVNNASTNCLVTTIAWGLALAQIALEGLNMGIRYLAVRQKAKAYEAAAAEGCICGRAESFSEKKFGKKMDGYDSQLNSMGSDFDAQYKQQIDAQLNTEAMKAGL